MTTITLSSFCVLAIAIYAIIELFLWGIELLFPTIQKIVCYFMKKPCSWEDGYIEARMAITLILQKISWGEMSAKELVKYRKIINNKKNFKKDIKAFQQWKHQRKIKRINKKQSSLNKKKNKLERK